MYVFDITHTRELVDTVHKNVTIHWAIRDNFQAYLRVLVKLILWKYGYPPLAGASDSTVLEQAKLLS